MKEKNKNKVKDNRSGKAKKKADPGKSNKTNSSMFSRLASNEPDAARANPKLERTVYIAKVFVAAVLIIILGCWVRSPDRQVLNNMEGYETWVSESGLPYFLDPDSYYHVRISQDIAENGHFGTRLTEDLVAENIDGKEEVLAQSGSFRDFLRDVPYGSETGYTPAIIYVSVFLSKIAGLFGGANIVWIDFWLPCFFVLITVPIAWLFTRRAYIAITGRIEGSDAAGGAGAILVTCAPAFVSRSLCGNFETDMPQAMFMMLLMLFMTETMRSKTLKRAVLCAIGFAVSTLLYVRFWSASALALAGVAAVGGGIYVVSLLFSGGTDKTINEAKTKGRFASWLSEVPVKMYLATGLLALAFFVTPKGRPYLNSIIAKIESYLPGHYSQELNAFNSISELARPELFPPFFPHWFLGHLRNSSLTVVNGCGGILMIVAAIACLIVLHIGRYAFKNQAGLKVMEMYIFLFLAHGLLSAFLPAILEQE